MATDGAGGRRCKEEGRCGQGRSNGAQWHNLSHADMTVTAEGRDNYIYNHFIYNYYTTTTQYGTYSKRASAQAWQTGVRRMYISRILAHRELKTGRIMSNVCTIAGVRLHNKKECAV